METSPIELVMRQTDYTEDVAREKLIHSNNNPITVIKEFMGITEKKTPEIKSVNQEIYKQLRIKLDDSIRDFNKKQYQKIEEDVKN